MFKPCLILLAVAYGVAPAFAQQPFPTNFSPELAERPEVRAALAFVDENFDQQVAEVDPLTEIPAPSGPEEARAAYVRAEFEKPGLEPMVDGIGNVIARRAGTGGGRPRVWRAP